MKNPGTIKRVWLKAGIASAALWALLGAVVLPMHERVDTLASGYRELAKDVTERTQIVQNDNRFDDRMRELLDRAESLGDVWSLTRSERALYERVTTLAAESGVAVDAMEPTRSARARAVSGAGGESTGFENVSYQIAIHGSYAQVADYIGRLEFDCGMTSIVSFDIRPDPSLGAHGVRGSLTTRHTLRDPSIGELRSRIAAADLAAGGEQP